MSVDRKERRQAADVAAPAVAIAAMVSPGGVFWWRFRP